MQPAVPEERRRGGQKTKGKVHLSNDRCQQVIFPAEGHLLGPGGRSRASVRSGGGLSKDGFSDREVYKVGQVAYGDEETPALFWARGEDRAGDRQQGRKFPTDFGVGLPKAGDGTRGASGLLKIL